MSRSVKIFISSILILIIILFTIATHIFSNMVLHPHWHSPGLTEKCSTAQREFSPELCVPHPEDNIKLQYYPFHINNSKEALEIDGWLFPSKKQMNRIVIFVHGAGADRRNGYKLVLYLINADFDVLLYDAPNHGRSTNNQLGVSYGVRESRGFLLVLDWARKQYKNVVVIATSAGTSAFILAKDSWNGKVDAAVIENPFYSMKRIIEENPISKYLPKIYLDFIFWYISYKGKFPFLEVVPGELVKNFPDIPVIVLHGTEDKTTPYQHGVDLFQNLNVSNKEFFTATGVGHCRIWDKFPKEFEEKTLRVFEDGIKKRNLNK
jgi:hypothetical protein